MTQNIGERISPILEEIEIALFEHQADARGILKFTPRGTRAAIKIFMDAMLAEMWSLQQNENIPQEDRGNMAHQLGCDLRKIIKTYTNIDTFELYNHS